MDDGQASTQPAFLTGYRRQRAEITVVAPDKDECPVDARPGERPSQAGLGRYASDTGTAKRRRSLHYVEPTTERDVGTTPGREDDCRDAGRLQGCRS